MATHDDAVVGFATAGPGRGEDTPRDLELYTIYVLATAHGSGTGQALLDAAVADSPAFLWVAQANARAQAFYRRNGFAPDGGRYAEQAFEDLPHIRMVR